MPKPQALGPRRAARYAAIQALYQAEVAERPAVEVMAEFEAHRLNDLFVYDETGERSETADRDLFQRLVAGAAAANLDPQIEAALSEGWNLERCGYTLRSILRLGTYELAHRHEVDVATIVTEYVELARGFFEGREPAFIHAVLDRLAPDLRRPPTSLSDLVEPGPGDPPEQL